MGNGDHSFHLLSGEYSRQLEYNLKFREYSKIDEKRKEDPFNISLIENAGAYLAQSYMTKKKVPHFTKDLIRLVGDIIPKNSDLPVKSKDYLDKLDKRTTEKIKSLIERNVDYPFIKSELIKKLEKVEIKRDRVFMLDDMYVFKFPDMEDKRDDNCHEACVGLQANEVRKLCPNFVWTYGICQLEPPKRMLGYSSNESYLCCITEKVSGKSFSKTYSSFQDSFLILAQIWMSLAWGQMICGLTHYDLHAGNVIDLALKEPMEFKYPWCSFSHNHVARIIDWGRSFAFTKNKIHIGRVIPGQSVTIAPNYFYDCFFILQRTLDEREFKNPEVKLFLDFFGLIPTDKLYTDMKKVAHTKYDWNKWLDLIFNCPSGKKYLTRIDGPNPFEGKNRGKENILEIKKADIIELPEEFNYLELKNYLRSGHQKDAPLVRKQIDHYRRWIAMLNEAKTKLDSDTPIDGLLKKNVDEKTNNQQETYFKILVGIAEKYKSKGLIPFIDEIIGKIYLRLDYLVQWTSFI